MTSIPDENCMSRLLVKLRQDTVGATVLYVLNTDVQTRKHTCFQDQRTQQAAKTRQKRQTEIDPEDLKIALLFSYYCT
jgi:hypothetical protein